MHRNTPSEAIFFDFGGTLFDLSPSLMNEWRRIIYALNPMYWNEERFFRAVAFARRWLDLETANRVRNQLPPELSSEHWRHYYSLILEHLQIEYANRSHLIDEISNAVNKISVFYSINPETVRMLNELKGSFKLGIISNTTRDLRSYFSDSGTTDIFKNFAFSYELNLWKPDPRIFQVACHSIGVSIDKAMYVGDSLYCDVMAAQMAGMQAVLIDPWGDYSWDGPKIKNLSELLQVIFTGNEAN